jgi:hypothetical protein
MKDTKSHPCSPTVRNRAGRPGVRPGRTLSIDPDHHRHRVDDSKEAACPAKRLVVVEESLVGNASQEAEGVPLDAQSDDPDDEGSRDPFRTQATVAVGEEPSTSVVPLGAN